MRRAFLASSVVAFILALSGVQAQTPPPTPIKSFAEVAGKWDGVGSSGTKVSFEISDKGVFAVSSPVGANKGTATLENALDQQPRLHEALDGRRSARRRYHVSDARGHHKVHKS